MHKTSVLVIDDEPDNFEVIEAFLGYQNYQLHYVSNGHDALTSLETLQPDVILLDVMMPGLDGLEVCRRIKATETWQTIPIIMVTALSTKENLAHCLATGADDFVSKPISSMELRARVQSMIRIKHQHDRITTSNQLQKETIHALEHTLHELRGGIASSLSHELNTPLVGVISAIELIKDLLQEGELEEISELLDIAEQSTCRLERLIKRLMTYLELEVSTRQPTVIQPTRTRFSASAISPALSAQAQSANRSEDLILDVEDTDITLPERYLSMILYELVDNALKFSPPNTPITVSSHVLGKMLLLSVQDSGRGMTEDQLLQIGTFMQFDRTTYEQQGIGLGLNLVKSIVEHIGGDFSITSIHQKETTIKFTLPLVD